MVGPSLISEQSGDNVDIDRSVGKIVAIVSSAVIFAALFSFFLIRFNFVYSLIAVVLFLAIFTLQAFFIKDWNVLFFAVFFEVLAIAIPFYEFFSLILLGLFFLFAFSLFFAVLSGRRELKNALNIPFLKVARSVLISGIMVMILLTSSVFIFGGIGNNLVTEESFQKSLDPVVGLMAPIISPIVPDFSPEMPLGNLVSGIMKKQLQGIDQFKMLSESARNNYLSKSSEDYVKSIGEFLKVPLNSNKSISQNIYMVSSASISSKNPQEKDYLGFLALLTIWLTVGSIASIFYIPVAIITYIIFEILLAMEFGVIQYESRSREIIILK
jgi:hypothetical protein